MVSLWSIRALVRVFARILTSKPTEPNDDRNLDEAWEDAAKLSKAWRLRRARLILATGEFQAARLATAQVPEDSLDPDFLYVRALAVMLEDGPDSVTQVDEILKKGGALKKGSTNKVRVQRSLRAYGLSGV